MISFQNSRRKVCLSFLLLLLVVTSECTFFRVIHMQPKSAACKPNCCANKKCTRPKCQPNQMMKPHSGWCGCCPKCMVQLKENDPCQPKPKRPCPIMPSSECGCGLKCFKGKCCKQ